MKKIDNSVKLNFDLNSKIIKCNWEISKRLFLIERNNQIFKDFVSEVDYKSTNKLLDACLSQLEQVSSNLKQHALNQTP